MASTQETPPSEALQSVQKLWARQKESSPVYQYFLSDIEIVSATKGVITAHLKVQPNMLNSKGTLHGTISACLTDWAGGMAIASTGMDKTGVSTDIHTTFISTAKEGDLLEVEARASKVGMTLAFTTVEIRRVGHDGAKSIVSTGSHTKYVKQR